jgi:hypothetical protein
MGVRLTVRVQFPDGSPVSGAQIRGVNHDAWSAKHRDWPATTDLSGTHTWDSIDKGTLGDRYTFSATATDLRGDKWVGEVAVRLSKDTDLVITLHRPD